MNASSRPPSTRLLLSFLLLAELFLSPAQYHAADPSLQRPLNPGPNSSPSKSPADRWFRIAFQAANAGDFNTAIINYQRAAAAVPSDCDKAHAAAGQRAALEAKGILKMDGWSGRPTQVFWLRLQELTKGLPCVTTR